MSQTLAFFKKEKRFKEPYDILLDGSFINWLLLNKRNRHHIAKALCGGNFHLVTTRCATQLQNDFKIHETKALKDLHISHVSCSHKKKMSAVDCILSKVKDGNPDGFFVATEDKQFVSHLQEFYLVPTITCFGKGMVLRKPSDYQKEALANEDVRENARGLRVGRRGLGPV
ncbi:rRNA-processing protein UTP23 [Artemisia annua]|uniref:rRNA-processing protein UTP23 n=1 Tax=Artemisia annua TaxID=35608 RepID=A0A2U1QIV8_ARTAN|nr:rRNA-processing protein UTP23 [Artemisia annua]